MSHYTDDWHATPPAIRDFYRNFHHNFLRFARRIIGDPDPPFLEWFTTFGWDFHAYFSYSVAFKNWTWQRVHLGGWDRNLVVFAEHFGFNDPSPGPPYGLFGIFSWGDQFIDIPGIAHNYPRATLKVPRTYWTGKPVKRRNI